MAANKRSVGKAAAAKERLARSAARQFALHGYEGTTLRSIAEGADVAFQLIEYHFGSKEQLWRAAVNTLLEDMTNHALGESYSFDRERSLEEQFREHIVSIFRYSRDNPQLRQMLIQEKLAKSGRGMPFEAPLLMAQRVTMAYVERVRDLGIVTRFSPVEVIAIIQAFNTAVIVGELERLPLVPADTAEEDRVVQIAHFVADLIVHGSSSVARGR